MCTRLTRVPCALIVVWAPAVATAGGGDLDPDFGSGGTVTTDLGSQADIGHGVAIQTDGKIVVAGRMDTTGNSIEDFALARYLPNGTLDTTFGSGGKVTTDVTGAVDFGFAMAIQDDGKIVLRVTATAIRDRPTRRTSPSRGTTATGRST